MLTKTSGPLEPTCDLKEGFQHQMMTKKRISPAVRYMRRGKRGADTADNQETLDNSFLEEEAVTAGIS